MTSANQTIAKEESHIITAIQTGSTLVAVCDGLGIERRDLISYGYENPIFGESLKNAKKAGDSLKGMKHSLILKQRTIVAIDAAIKRGHELVKDSKNDLILFAQKNVKGISNVSLSDYKSRLQLEIEGLKVELNKQ